MTDKERYIRERTNVGIVDVTERLLSVPIDERKAIVFLVNHLHEKSLLTGDDINSLLWEARRAGADR
jgi:hypothetical protein